ncbi:MAG: site-specific DNA-methyltransferase [Deltaproteobacteria bacterium]|nr:site-specific DNA-methyltransferase [Deltaproteobacteria bacterium]
MAILNFKGKTFVQNHHLAVKYYELVPKKDKSLTDKISLNDNLIIHGDNLKALKALLPTYAGKVKCIYIDPPYNTGNERWVYNDNVNSPMMQEWLGKVVDREDMTRHDKWLCLMMPRLKLLRELLREDGVIFVSIDDNEVHHLRMLMDEVFGEDKFYAMLTWINRTKPTNMGEARFNIQQNTESILVYGRMSMTEYPRFNLFKTEEKIYSSKDKDGHYRTEEIVQRRNIGTLRRDTMLYPLLDITPKKGYRWQLSLKKYEELMSKKRLLLIKGRPFQKIYDFEEERFAYDPFWSHLEEVGTAEDGKQELNDIFGIGHEFETVKPLDLIKRIIFHSTSSNQDDIILDSFAGSGTTAHAVLDLNKEDGGNRKFILVECEDYADKITAERVRRVIKGVKTAKDEKLKNGLGGTFSFFELGDPIEMESILEGKKLPSYIDLARYVFYTATGEEFDPKKVNEKRNFIGGSKEYEVYLFYKPDIEYLKSTALTLDAAKSLGEYKGKKRLVFAPSKYLDTEYLLEYRIDYCQLPFEIYKLKG